MWIFGHNRSNYGIRYVYDTETNSTQDSIDFHGGDASNATVSIRLDTGDITSSGDLSITGTSTLSDIVAIKTDTDSNYSLKVNGNSYIEGTLTIKGTNGTSIIQTSTTAANTGKTWSIPDVPAARYFVGSVHNTFNQYGILYADYTTSIEATSAGANGAVLIGKGSSNAPTWVAAASGALYATAANGTPQFGKLPVAQGGTNATSVTKFGIAYGNSSEDGYTFTAAGTDGYILIGKGASAAPTWQQTLPVTHGGTGLTTSTYKNAVVIGNATTATSAFQTKRTASGAFYATEQDGAPSFGTLPVAQGGTGLTTSTYTNAVVVGNSTTATSAFHTIRTASGAFYATAQDGAPSFGTLPIAQGGTGVTTWAKGGIVYASAKDTFAQIADGTANKVLYCSGSATYGWLSYTSSNTVSTLVYRDASGNFSAGTITASLSGNATSATKANITSNKYGIAYYSDTAGTFATTAQGTAGRTLIAGGSSAAPTWYGGLSLTGAGTSASPYAASFSNTVQTGGNVGINVAPDDTYTLKVSGQTYLNSTTASSTNNLSSQLIVANSTSNGANVAIELWRGGTSSNVGSWQIANESAYLYFRSNWYKGTNDNAAKRQDTYGLQSLRLFPETGNGSIPGLAIGQTAQNTSYKLYVNGTSKLDGDTEVGGDLDPGTTASHSIGALAKAWDNIVGNDFYVGANGARYGRFYAYTEGTTTTTGLTILTIGNETATGTANNSKGSLRIYSTNTLYQGIVADEPSGTTPDDRTWHLPSVPGNRSFVGTTTTGFPYTQYGVCYAGGDTYVSFTGAGTAGYLLQAGGSSAAPSWIQATNANTASTIVKRDASGNFSAGTITASLSGNATSATKFNSTRTVKLTGSVTGSATADGSSGWEIATTTNHTHATLTNRTSLTKGTNPSGSTSYYTTAYVYETGSGTAEGNRIAWIGGGVDTSGQTTYTIKVYKYTSGSTTGNAFTVGITQDGTVYYSVTNKSAFRTAIGVGDSGTHADSYFALASHGTHVTTATVQSALSIDTSSGSTSKCLTEKGTWASFTNNAGTVTSITISAGAGITVGSATTAITTSGTRTISITGMDTSSGSTTKCLTEKGTWASFTNNAGTVTSITLSEGAGISLSATSAITTSGTRTISIDGMNTSSGSTTKWLNQKGGWTTPTAADVSALSLSGGTSSILTATIYMRAAITKGTSTSSTSGRSFIFLQTGTGTDTGDRMGYFTCNQYGGTLNTRIGMYAYKSVAASTSSTHFLLAYNWDGTTEVKRTITDAKIYGAVWNDYAEYRQTLDDAKPGQVVVDHDDGSLSLTTKRLQIGAQVVTDTFGFAIGETEKTKTPLAVSGRVLVNTYRNRYEYHAGQAVCSAPDGTVDIMSRDEIMMYPDAIIGIVSEIPEYEVWGQDNVPVNGRIWIKVR